MAKKKAAGTLSLPKTPNIPSTKLTDYSLCLYGEKGIGKSSLAAQFPGAITFMFEPGRQNLAIRQVPKRGEPQLTWPVFKEYLNLCVEDSKVGTVIIDSVDKCYELAFDWICAGKKIDHPSQINDYGKTWAEIKKEFETTFNALIFLDVMPVFISHSRLRPAPGRKTEEEAPDMVQPTCLPSCWEYLKQVTDLAFYYGFDEYDRILHLRGSEFIWSSCGFDDHFLDPKTKEPLDAIPMGATPKEAYVNLTKSWANKLEGFITSEEE